MTLSDGNPMRTVLLTLLLFEVVVFGLSIPVMIYLSDVSGGTATVLGAGAALVALAAAGLLRKPVGYLVGWLAQLAGVALGFATSSMFAIGGLFLLLWVISIVLGKRLDRMHPEAPA